MSFVVPKSGIFHLSIVMAEQKEVYNIKQQLSIFLHKLKASRTYYYLVYVTFISRATTPCCE
jgi:hypothetical protein